MKTFLLTILLALLLSSCNRKISISEYRGIESRVVEETVETIAVDVKMAHQTKRNIGFEVSILNNSTENISFSSRNFFFAPEDFGYSVDAYDPEYLRFQVEHPMEALVANSNYDWERKGVAMDVSLMSEVFLETDSGYASMSGIRFLRYLSQVRDYKEVLIDQLLEEVTLKPREEISGLIYFSKKDFKRNDWVYVSFDYNGNIERRKFLVGKWKD